jgi:hypothetical protein
MIDLGLGARNAERREAARIARLSLGWWKWVKLNASSVASPLMNSAGSL